jgi:hypothetical protein
MTGTADDGGEDGPGCIVAGKSGLAHAGPVVNNKSCNLVVTHDDGCWGVVVKFTNSTQSSE